MFELLINKKNFFLIKKKLKFHYNLSIVLIPSKHYIKLSKQKKNQKSQDIIINIYLTKIYAIIVIFYLFLFFGYKTTHINL